MNIDSRRLVPALSGVALAAMGLLLAPAAQAQLKPGFAILGKDPGDKTTDTFMHADIGLAFNTPEAPDAWFLHVHVDPPVAGFEEEYSPDDALLYIGESARFNLAADVPFLGATAGQTIWLNPQNNPAPSPVLWLGIGAEENVPADFSGNPISLNLLSVTGFNGAAAPGNFAIWQTTLNGPNVVMTTADGISAADTLIAAIGGHDHYNIAFTAPGVYEVTFEAVSTPVGGPPTSGPVTYYFGVEAIPTVNAAAAPEPVSVSLLALGAVGGLVLRRRSLR